MTATAPLPPVAGAGDGQHGANPALQSDRHHAQPVRHPRALRFALLLGAVVAMADATIVAVALAPLSRHFGEPLAAVEPVLIVYLVTVTATLPLLGRLSDRFGRREVYMAGFAVFAGGSVGAALAPTFGILLAARAVQAVGGGMLTSGSLALIAQWSPRRSAGRAIALLVIAQAVAGLLAPPLGGALVAVWDWQAVFWAGVPLALGGAALTLWAVPPTAGEDRPGGLDPLGALGVGMLLFGLGSGFAGLAGDAVAGLPGWAWLTVAAAGAALLVAAEPRVSHPIVDRRLLGGHFGRAAVATFLSTGSLMTCFALLPFWLETAHGASAALAGMAFVPIGAGIAATSRRAGHLGDSGRTREVTVAGMLVAAAGLGLAAGAGLANAWWLLGIGLFVLGLGNGLFSSPNTAAAMQVAPRSGLSGAAGLLSTARNAGVICGLGVAGAVYTAATRGGSSTRADAVAAAIFVAAAALCLLVAVLAADTYRVLPAAVARPAPARAK
jgi:MFS family permease